MMRSVGAAILAGAFLFGCGGSKKDPEMPEIEEETVDENDNPVAEPDEASEESVPTNSETPGEGDEGDEGDDGDGGDDGSDADDPDAEDPGEGDDPE